MKNKQIREMLNVQQVQYESKQTLEIMRQNTSYPTQESLITLPLLL